MDLERALERTLTQITHDIKTPPSTPARKRVLAELDDDESPTARRQPLANANGMHEFAVTPTKSPGAFVVEPLSIKKKQSQTPSIRSSPSTHRRTQSVAAQRGFIRGSPKSSISGSSHAPSRGLSVDRGRQTRPVVVGAVEDKDVGDRLLVLAETTKEDVSAVTPVGSAL